MHTIFAITSDYILSSESFAWSTFDCKFLLFAFEILVFSAVSTKLRIVQNRSTSPPYFTLASKI